MTTPVDAPMVLYAVIRRDDADGKGVRFLVRRTDTGLTFPPTKMDEGLDLYKALDRIMEGDLQLPRKSFYPEHEFPAIENAPNSPAYEKLPDTWYLYPVAVSLTDDAMAVLGEPAEDLAWMSLDDFEAATDEPNTLAIIRFLRTDGAEELSEASLVPSMDALACYWTRFHDGGVRFVRGETVRKILAAGGRAFNLRVADPYQPYHRQGQGFTWSFFTPRDKQDLHVHGQPAVEIYGVIEGRLQLWHKPMNERGVRTWRCRTLKAGDWAEVEPLNCHFAAWLDPEGLGTVIKAAGSGELAGVGRIGVAGKTVCVRTDADGCEQRCSNYGYCALPPAMQILMDEYRKPFADRDYTQIAKTATSGD